MKSKEKSQGISRYPKARSEVSKNPRKCFTSPVPGCLCSSALPASFPGTSSLPEFNILVTLKCLLFILLPLRHLPWRVHTCQTELTTSPQNLSFTQFLFFFLIEHLLCVGMRKGSLQFYSVFFCISNLEHGNLVFLECFQECLPSFPPSHPLNCTDTKSSQFYLVTVGALSVPIP